MFSGSLVAIVTPLAADGGLDLPGWDRLLEFHLAEGTDGIVVGGTTGESPTLSTDEIELLVIRAIERCRGKLKVVVGAGSNCTATTMARCVRLSRLGVDGVMLVTPYYNKPPQEGLFRHFMAAADASAAPVILYNVPARTGVDLLPVTVGRLARHPRIVALKEANPLVSRVRELVASCPDQFSVLSGDDATAIDFIEAGAKGVISVSANVAPRRVGEACRAAMAGDLATARAIDGDLRGLHRDLFVEANPIPVKWAVARMGLIGGVFRLPLIDLAQNHHETVLRAMLAAGVKFEDKAA